MGLQQNCQPGCEYRHPGRHRRLHFCHDGLRSRLGAGEAFPDGQGIKAEEVYFLPFNQFANHHGGVVIVGDYIYGGNGQNQGFPTCIEWKTGKIVWGGKERGPGSGSAAICYADGRLYFRYEDGTMASAGAHRRTDTKWKGRSRFRM